MKFYITDEIVSQFLSGLLPILILIAVGASLSVLFKRMRKQFMFTRMALVLALPPLSLIHFLEQETTLPLYLFSMIITLLGILIDGGNHLLIPKERPKPKAEKMAEDKAADDQEPEVIIWEKAE